MKCIGQTRGYPVSIDGKQLLCVEWAKVLRAEQEENAKRGRAAAHTFFAMSAALMMPTR